jgi:hypothetical protein
VAYHIDEDDGGTHEEARDMRHLERPRGKGYSLRIKTPEVLVGTENPWTGKPFGKTLQLGLDTTKYAEAVRTRDVRIGQLWQLEAEAKKGKGQKSIGGIIDLSPENAKAWRELRAVEGDEHDLILTEQLDRATEAGYAKRAQQFADVVLKGKLPLAEALEQYLDDRVEGNPLGLDPLKRSTMNDVRSSVKHLAAYLGDGATLADVTVQKAFRFRTEYLEAARQAEGKYLGKKPSYNREALEIVLNMLGQGAGASEVSKHTGLSRQTVIRIRKNPAKAKAALGRWGQ